MADAVALSSTSPRQLSKDQLATWCSVPLKLTTRDGLCYVRATFALHIGEGSDPHMLARQSTSQSPPCVRLRPARRRSTRLYSDISARTCPVLATLDDWSAPHDEISSDGPRPKRPCRTLWSYSAKQSSRSSIARPSGGGGHIDDSSAFLALIPDQSRLVRLGLRDGPRLTPPIGSTTPTRGWLCGPGPPHRHSPNANPVRVDRQGPLHRRSWRR